MRLIHQHTYQIVSCHARNSNRAPVGSTSIGNCEWGLMHVALSLHSLRECTCFTRIEILNVELSMQSYKIYCQKSSVIVPDKWIKIIGILWHIIHFPSKSWMKLVALRLGQIKLNPFHLRLWKFERSRIELKFRFGGPALLG